MNDQSPDMLSRSAPAHVSALGSRTGALSMAISSSRKKKHTETAAESSQPRWMGQPVPRVAAGAASRYLGHTALVAPAPRRGFEPGYQQLLKAKEKAEAEAAKIEADRARVKLEREKLEAEKLRQHNEALFARAAQFAT